MRTRLLIAALLSAAALAVAVWVLRPVDAPVAAVTRGDTAEVVYATGVVEPVRWAEITTTVRARIVESCGCEGVPVARGDPLFRLDAITPMGDSDLKTYRVRLALPPDTPLMIGMSVDVNIVERVARDVLLDPAAAVIHGAVVALEDGRMRRVPVGLGIAGPDDVELAEGGAEGMRVVSPALDDLRDGMRARAAPGAAP